MGKVYESNCMHNFRIIQDNDTVYVGDKYHSCKYTGDEAKGVMNIVHNNPDRYHYKGETGL